MTDALAQLHVRIDAALFRALKVCAAERGTTLQVLVAELLTRGLKAGAKLTRRQA